MSKTIITSNINNNINNNNVGVVDEDLHNLISTSLSYISEDNEYSFMGENNCEHDLNLFAELCVNLLFGNYINPEDVPVVEEEEVEEEEVELSLEDIQNDNPDKGMYRVVVTEDREVESFIKEEFWMVEEWEDDMPTFFSHWVDYIPTHCLVDNMSCYFTNSGDNPVIFEQAILAEARRSAGGWSDLDNQYGIPQSLESYVSDLTYRIERTKQEVEWRVRTNKWTDLIRDQILCDEPALNRLRSLFWKRIYAAKEEGKVYVKSAQVEKLAKEFRWKGSWLLKRDMQD